MKQTAVEWLRDKLLNPDVRLERDMYDFIYKLIEQAKEMEKEQIKEAWLNSLTKGDFNSAEQYYTETYESNTRI